MRETARRRQQAAVRAALVGSRGREGEPSRREEKRGREGGGVRRSIPDGVVRARDDAASRENIRCMHGSVPADCS